MSKPGRLQHVTNQYRAALRARESQAEQQLELAYAHVIKTLQPALDRLYDQMVNAMADGEKIPIHWLIEANRLESIKSLISGEIDHFGALSRMEVGQIQHYAVQLGQKSAMDMLDATVPSGVHWSFGVPDPKAIANIVGATQAGSPLADLFNGFGREAADLAGKALIRGVAMGDNPRKVAGDIQQALGVSRARALTISRTEMLRSYRQSSLETMRANSDVVGGWIWSAAMDARTCAACIAMNGTKHSLDEDMGTHPNCRCVQLPETNSWADILEPLGIDTSDIPDTTIQVQSGSDWFDNQDAATQKSILGSQASYDLYSSGKASLMDFVGHAHDSDWGHSVYQKSAKTSSESEIND